eukprot:8827657-Alexandrium_andersonii.AAC.1
MQHKGAQAQRHTETQHTASTYTNGHKHKLEQLRHAYALDTQTRMHTDAQKHTHNHTHTWAHACTDACIHARMHARARAH